MALERALLMDMVGTSKLDEWIGMYGGVKRRWWMISGGGGKVEKNKKVKKVKKGSRRGLRELQAAIVRLTCLYHAMYGLVWPAGFPRGSVKQYQGMESRIVGYQCQCQYSV
jgi:hypothetical protein